MIGSPFPFFAKNMSKISEEYRVSKNKRLAAPASFTSHFSLLWLFTTNELLIMPGCIP